MHISAWDLRDNVRSVILDWRQRFSGRSNELVRSAGLLSEWRDPLVAQAKWGDPLFHLSNDLKKVLSTQTNAIGETGRPLKQACHVCSPVVVLLHKKGPRHRRKICANYLRLYSYDIQSSPSKNRNIKYVYISMSPSLFVQRSNIRQYSAFPYALSLLKQRYDCLVSYAGHSLVESYPSAEMQSMYSTAPADLTIQDTDWGSLTPLQKCSRCILQPKQTEPHDTRWGSLTPQQRCSWCIL